MSARKIPVMRPLLPPASMITPYLEEIDKNRWYTNFGPLIFRFEHRMAQLFNLPESHMLSMSNGTSALTAMLTALDVEAGSFCIVPSWTFTATPASAISAGLIPYFADVDETTWTLQPEEVKQSLKFIPGKVGAVMVVAPFGQPVEVAPWDKFTEETGIPVVIDAAAAFDTLLEVPGTKIGKTPIMVSLHATKTFGVGEGAMVISNNAQLVHKIRQLSNFGFTASREIVIPGVNSKMSEYNAAIGLAALDFWPNKRALWRSLTDHYIAELATVNNPHIQHRFVPDWVTSTGNIIIPPGMAANVIEELALAGIESRKWWPKGCHQFKAYEKCPRFALPVTEKLVDTVIAVPFSVDLAPTDVQYIVSRLDALLQ